MKEEQKRKLRVFEMTVLRKICGVTWKDCRRNVDIWKELSIERDIISVIQCQQLTYFGQRQIAICTIIWLHTQIPRKRKTEVKMDR